MKRNSNINIALEWSTAELCELSPGPEVTKLFFMRNSAEPENFSADKYENANNSWHFHID